MVTKEEFDVLLADVTRLQLVEPTAMQLHSQKTAMVDRVQRQMDKIYLRKLQAMDQELSASLTQLGARSLPEAVINVPQRKLTRIESKRRLRTAR